MRRDLFALLSSLFVHAILLLLFLPLWGENPKQPPVPKRTSLGNLKIINDALTTLPAPQMPKNTNNQTLSAQSNTKGELTKIHGLKAQKKAMQKSSNLSKNPKFSDKRTTKEPQNGRPSSIPHQEVKPSQEVQTPNIYDLSRRFEESDIKELYGEDFFTLSDEEQEFIEDNLRHIGRITQRYLKYPQIAGELGEEGVNALEFSLHPNGDISDLRLINSSGYTILDKNSLATIKIAYKDYPRPKNTTKIRIKVHYHIIGR